MPIKYNQFIHPCDIKAKQFLNKIPAFRKMSDMFMRDFAEKSFLLQNMAGKIRLSEKQMPQIYNLLLPVCEKLKIEVPELYLELDRTPNAYTFGDKNAAIVITSGLVETMTNEEIQIVMAHECGHILCQHTLYSSIIKVIANTATLITKGITRYLYTNIIIRALRYWERCSELSADRVSAFFAGSSEPVVKVMMRLAGGGKNLNMDFNTDEFLNQAKQFKEHVEESTENSIFAFQLFSMNTHPSLTIRTIEITTWCSSDQFKSIINNSYNEELVLDNDLDEFNTEEKEKLFKLNYKDKIYEFCREVREKIELLKKKIEKFKEVFSE
ncbi:MAG: M48 family metallopeptidase [Bacilli bacterium]|nr:M48 family metallopeptidase [Bacilli bacterium]